MPVLPSYRNQSIDLHSNSIDYVLYESNTEHDLRLFWQSGAAACIKFETFQGIIGFQKCWVKRLIQISSENQTHYVLATVFCFTKNVVAIMTFIICITRNLLAIFSGTFYIISMDILFDIPITGHTGHTSLKILLFKVFCSI